MSATAGHSGVAETETRKSAAAKVLSALAADMAYSWPQTLIHTAAINFWPAIQGSVVRQ